MKPNKILFLRKEQLITAPNSRVKLPTFGNFTRVFFMSLSLCALVLFSTLQAQTQTQTLNKLGSDINKGVVTNDQTGFSVSLSADGTIVAIGAPTHNKTDKTGKIVEHGAGQVRIFKYTFIGGWKLLGFPINDENAGYNDQSGWSVSLSADGKTVAIGVPYHTLKTTKDDGTTKTTTDVGYVQVYKYNSTNTTWEKLGTPINGEAAGDLSGSSVSLSADGKIVAIGAHNHDETGKENAGHVRVYEYKNNNWMQLGADIDGKGAQDDSGYSVSLSADGKTVAIGAPQVKNNSSGFPMGSGYVRVYQYTTTGAGWTQLGADIVGGEDGDWSGWSVSLSNDGKTVAIGAPEAKKVNQNQKSGQVRVYQYTTTGAGWTQLGADIYGQSLNARWLGHSVSLSADGKRVAIGVPDVGGRASPGHVRVYKYTDTSWTQEGKDIDGSENIDRLGYAVSLSDDGKTVAIGAPAPAAGDKGYVRVYKESLYITSPSTAAVAENTNATVYTAKTARGAEDKANFSLVTSTTNDNALFNIDETTGAVSFKKAPDFETPTGINKNEETAKRNIYKIKITAKAGTGEAAQTATKDVAITVTNVVEAPVFSSAATASVVENTPETTTVYTASVSDVSTKEVVTFSLEAPSDAASVTADDDNTKFTIDGTSGEIKFVTAPDFENPLDANTDNVYHIQITATAGTGVTAQTTTKDVAITVTNVVEAPVFSSAATASVLENTLTTTAIYTAAVSDVSKKDEVTFSLKTPSDVASVTADDDNAKFTIDGSTGMLVFREAPDFENPLDANTDNVYHIQITATAGAGTSTAGTGEAAQTTTKDVAITVTNVVEAPVFSSAATASVVENTLTTMTVYTASVSDALKKDEVTFSLEVPSDDASVTADDDNARFSIGRSGEIKFMELPDFENPRSASGDNVYHIQITATAGAGTGEAVQTTTKDVAITVTNVVEAPVFSSAATASVVENTPETTTVYTASVSDVSTKEVVTFSLEAPSDAASVTADDDNTKFTIDGTRGEIKFVEVPDFENPLDANTDNVYHIQITATAGTGEAAQTTTKDVAITVTNVVEAPVFSSAATASVVENTRTATTVYTASVSDVSKKDEVTFSLKAPSADGTADDDNARFTIDQTSGEIKFVTAPDFENPLDANKNNIYNIQITATAGAGTGEAAKITTKEATITVTNVVETPVFSSALASAVNVQENTAINKPVYMASVSDVSTKDEVTFSLKAPSTDVTVTVDDDNAKFTIDGSTGMLVFREAPDFENPLDANTDNVYHIQITATAGAGTSTAGTTASAQTATKEVMITVTNLLEVPVFSSALASAVNVQENTAITKPVYMASVSDASKKDEVTFSLKAPSADGTADDDNAKFTIDGSTGMLVFRAVPDFENPLDANTDNVYNIQITATSGTGVTARTDTKDIAIIVTNLVEAPVFSSLASAVNVQENTAITKPVYTASVSDVSTKEMVRFSLERPSAAVTADDDNAKFRIDATSGEIKFMAVPDFENPVSASGDNVYHIQITAKAGTGANEQTTTKEVTITVTNVVEAPVFSSALVSAVNVQENTAITKPVYMASVSDVSTKDEVTFSLKAPSNDVTVTVDDDNVKFTIDGSTGMLVFREAPDFENPLDANTDNVYHIQITATAGTGVTAQTTTKDVAITVTNLLEVPVFSSAAMASVVENTPTMMTVYTASVSDVSTKEVVRFSLEAPSTEAAVTVDDDNTKFTIDETSGEIKFMAVPDFENPVSASGDNVYHIQITATAGAGTTASAQTATKNVAITVTNVVEAPVFSSALASAVNVQENTAITKPVYMASVSDVSTKEVVTFSLEAPSADAAVTVDDDNAKFRIDGTSGEIKFMAVPDFENPVSASGDNVYHIQITATAGTGVTAQTDTKDVAIIVTNLVEVPVFSSAATASVVENTLTTMTVYTASVSDVSSREVVNFSLKAPSAEAAVTVDDDNAKFTIDRTSGEIKFVAVPDFESPLDANTDNVYHIQITATAGTGEAAQTATKDVAITVTNMLEVPVFSSAATASVVENTPTTMTVYTAGVSDVPSKDAVTFSLKAPSTEAAVTVDDDNAKFTIDGTSGEIKFVAVPDFENPSDANTDNVYHIQITATSGTGVTARTDTKDVAIIVTNLVEAPVFSSALASAVNVQENTAITKPVYMASVSDVSTKEVVTFSLERPSADAAVTVDDDNAKFRIDGTSGEIKFMEVPDFENPVSVSGDNIYHIQITATAGTGEAAQTATKEVMITVTNVVEAPVFSSALASAVNVQENTAITKPVYTASVSDVSTKEMVRFSLERPSAEAAVTVDDDNTKFTIDRTSGEIKFVAVPDFENPVSASGDNVYHIQITATSGTGGTAQTATKEVMITVTNLLEVPVFSSAATASVVENTPTTMTVYTASVSDVSTKEVVTFSLASPSAAVTVDDDNTKFTIDGTSGEIKFVEVPDFENPVSASGDNVYHIQITATAGTGEAAQTATKDVAITVTNVVEAPVFSSALASAVNVQENTAITKPVYTASVSDVSTKELVIFSLEAPSAEAAVTVDDDNTKFTIDRTSGEIKFMAVPDFENPLDANTDNVYHIQITAKAGTGEAAQTATKDVAIIVTNVVEAPVFSSALASAVNVQENTAITKPVYMASVSDMSTKEMVRFSLERPSAEAAVTADDDNAKFRIDGTSGEIKFMEVPDFENPLDAGEDNVYHIQITATAGTGEAAQTATKDVAITVMNLVEAPVFSSALASAVNVQENTAITKPVYMASVSDVSSKDAVTFSLKAPSTDVTVTVDDDNAKFTIDGTSGEIKFVAVPDFENPSDANTNNVYHIQITATSGTGGTARTDTKDVAIIVTNLVETPVFSSTLASAVNVQENTAITKPVYMASVSDASAKEMVRFSLERPSTDAAVTVDDDNTKFTIDRTSGEIKFVEVPDFENPLDANTDNVYHIQITATAGTGVTAQTTTKDVAITVTNLLEAPVFSSALASAVNVQENTAITKPVYMASVSDVSTKEMVRFSLERPSTDAAVTVDDDNTKFTIDRTSGEIKFVEVPDFENPLDAGEDNVYHIQITATAGTGGEAAQTATKEVMITVTNVVEAPVFSSALASAVNVQENTAITKPVYTASVSDVSTKEVVTFSLKAPSTEAAVTVDDDNTKFTIDRTSGEIKFVEVPDFENPLDANTDNVYHIQITATAGAGTSTAGTGEAAQTATKDVAITVTNVVEAPVFSSALASAVNVQENTAITKPVYTVSVSDVSTKELVIFSLEAPSAEAAVTVDDDNTKFTIDRTSGEIKFMAVPDFENPLDAGEDNVYHIQITATAGTGEAAQTATKEVVITVTNVVEAPVFSPALASAVNVQENTAITKPVYMASVSDVSTKELVIFSLEAPSAEAAVTVDDDNTKFTIDRTSGEIKFVEVPDFENPVSASGDNVYHIQITATSGTGGTAQTATKEVMITVTNVVEGPVFSSALASAVNVQENTAITKPVYMASVSDVSSKDAVTFSLEAPSAEAAVTVDDDNTKFTIDRTSGEIKFMAVPDFENPLDANTDNVYHIQITATAGTGEAAQTATKEVVITVTNVVEGPVFSSALASAVNVQENTAITKPVYMASVSDVSTKEMVRFSLEYPSTDAAVTVDDDNTKFTIDRTSGEIKFMAVPDFENPLDANTDNVYHIQITATAGTGEAAQTATKEVVITVTNVVEGPVFSSALASAVNVQENTAITKPVYTVGVSDVSTKELVIFSLEAPSAEAAVTVDDDNAKFTIDGTSGEIKFVEVPDFENPSDANTNNVYHIQITATSGTGGTARTDTKDIAIIVTNVVETPVFSSALASAVNVQENTAITKPVYMASVSDASSKDAVTFSLEAPSATVTVDDDNARFTIDGSTGMLVFREVPDFENPLDTNRDNVYHIQITATSGTGGTARTATKEVMITVTNVNDTAPVITSSPTATVAENTTDFTYTITANEAATFALGTAGGDEEHFKLEGAKLSFKAAPDFEMPKDTNKDNVYKLELKATDEVGNANAGTFTLSIEVTDVAEQGSISLPETLAFADTKVGETLVKDLTISNSGTVALKVTAITYPAGFMGDWTSGEIAAGGQKVVKVTFIPIEAKAYTGMITITSDAANVGTGATDGKNMIPVSGKGVLITGIEPQAVFPELSVFPNPVADVLNIKLPNQTRPVSLQLVDVNGQVVYEQDAVTTNELSIDVSGYRSGVYVLMLQTRARGGSESKVTKRKVVIR